MCESKGVCTDCREFNGYRKECKNGLADAYYLSGCNLFKKKEVGSGG